jgi:sugar phosphate isomerase/epimerase
MINVGNELAVQSYCFRHFKDNAVCADMVRQCGLARIELCGVHVNFADAAACDRAIDAYKKAGVRVVSIGVSSLKGDEAAERPLFEFLKKAGARHMSVDFAVASVPESYRVAERLAEAYGVRLGIHNHGGRHWLGPAAMLAQVFATTSDRIGLCLDTAWALDSGEDPVAMAERFAPRLTALHLKDFVFDKARKPTDVVVGTGNLDLAKLRATLQKIDFSGLAILEYEGDVEDPVPAVSACVKAVRAAMK